jgi:iron complex transport system substrate-binding protein
MAPNLTEIAFAAGAGELLSAVTTADTYPPEVAGLPRFNALPVDYEALVALKPDLLLATDHVNSVADAERLENLGIPVFFINFTSLDDVFAGIRKVGRIAGTYERANEHASLLESTIQSLADRTDSVDARPGVLVLVSDSPLFSFGSDSYVHEIIRLAGGTSVTADLDASGPVLSDEFVLSRQPDVIIGAFGEDYDPSSLGEKHVTWNLVPAVRNRRVYSLDPDVILRPGPRLVEGAFRAAMMLHPDLFGAESPSGGQAVRVP